MATVEIDALGVTQKIGWTGRSQISSASDGNVTITNNAGTANSGALTVGSLTIGGGAAISKVLRGTATFDPVSLVDGAGATTTVTVTGAALGDHVIPSFSLDLQGITVTAYVSAADTVSVRFQNESGATVDLASGTLAALVVKP